jgi:hypothetical protein
MEINDQVAHLEQEIAAIKERNRRVESDKAWEISWVRALSIIVLTYGVALLTMVLIRVADPFLNALIPTFGFILSIQSLPFVKRWWVHKHYEKSHSSNNI